MSGRSSAACLPAWAASWRGKASPSARRAASPPGAHKDIDAVMAAQSDLLEIVHTLHQVACMKG